MFRCIRASRHGLARASCQRVVPRQRTLITPSAVRQVDLVQELYLRELKAHKPTPIKPSDSQGHVQEFTAPKPPRSPEEGNLVNELEAYEKQPVEVEGQAAAGEAGATEEDWFEEEDEEESHSAH